MNYITIVIVNYIRYHYILFPIFLHFDFGDYKPFIKRSTVEPRHTTTISMYTLCTLCGYPSGDLLN